jgi:WD40 repeat protein
VPAAFEKWFRRDHPVGVTAATADGRFVAAADSGPVDLFGPTGMTVVPVEGKPNQWVHRAIPNPTWPQRINSQSPDSSLGHVYDLEFSRDGERLAAGCEGGLAVWQVRKHIIEDTPRYMLYLHLLIHCGNVTSVALHPEGKLVATVGREVRLWSCPDGRPVASLPLPRGATQVEFSADGQLLLAISGRQAVLGWPVGDTPEKRRLLGQRGSGVPTVAFSPFPPETHGVGVPGVAFSPDGRTLASVSKDMVVRLWDPATGQLLHHSWGHNAEIEAVAFSSDGRLLATGDFGGAVYVWNAADLTEYVFSRPSDPLSLPASQRNEPPGQVWRLQFDAAGEQLAAGGEKGVVVWSVRRAGKGLDVRRRAALATPKVYDLAFHPDGTSLAYLPKPAGGGLPAVCRLDLGAEAGRPLAVAARLQVRGLNFDPSGRLLTFVTPGGTLGRWDWEHNASMPAPPLPAFQWALSPGGRWAATPGPDNGVVVYDLDAGARVLALPPEESDVWSVAWSPDGQRLALGLSDGGITVWDLGQVCDRLADFGINAPSTRPPR